MTCQSPVYEWQVPILPANVSREAAPAGPGQTGSHPGSDTHRHTSHPSLSRAPILSPTYGKGTYCLTWFFLFERKCDNKLCNSLLLSLIKPYQMQMKYCFSLPQW